MATPEDEKHLREVAGALFASDPIPENLSALRHLYTLLGLGLAAANAVSDLGTAEANEKAARDQEELLRRFQLVKEKLGLP